jgi:hypothetical protein
MVQNGGFQGFGYRVVRLPRWAAFLIVAASVLVGLLFMVLAAGIALIVVPVVLVAGAIAAWFGRRRNGNFNAGHHRSDHRAAGGGDVVEGEYIVLDRDRTNGGDGRR